MSVYVCQCIGYDNDFTTKTYERIKFEYFDYPSDYSIFVRMEIGEDLFICCSEMIDFCYRMHIYIFFNKSCRKTKNSSISCFTLLKVGFRSVCDVCIFPLQVKLFPYLIKVK